MFVIVPSILVVVLASVPAVNRPHLQEMNVLEWSFTVLFAVEYIARLPSLKRPWRYATNFFGIIDPLSALPTYSSLFVPEAAA